MEGLQVLPLSAVNDKLAELAPDAELPWALIKSKVCEFAATLRKHGVFFVFSDDGAAINRLQPQLQAGKAWCAGLPSGNLFVIPCESAKNILNAHGQGEFGVMWGMAQPHLTKFMDVLYSHNCFVARGDELGAKFLDEKTQDKSVCIRVRGE